MARNAKSEYVNVIEASQLLDLSPATVRRLVNAGDLPGRKRTEGRTSGFRIPREAVAAYARRVQGRDLPAAPPPA